MELSSQMKNKPTVTHLLIELRNEDSGKNWATISCQEPNTDFGAERVDASKLHHNYNV